MTPSETARAPRAFITGMGGFTGRYMAERLLAGGYRVWGTARGASPDEPAAYIPPGATPLATDLLDAAALADAVQAVQPDVVVHLAAIAHVEHSDIASLFAVNVVGTRNLLDALARLPMPPRAVLLASSANVYGNATGGVIDEAVAPQPANDYALSKLAMEYLAKRWNDTLPITLVRPFNYTGVGQSDAYLLPKIVSHFARGERAISLGNFEVSRDFSDVRDVAEVYARLLETAPRGATFNVCSGEGRTLRSVLDLLAGIAGYEIDVRIDPRFVRANEVRTLVGSDRKLRAAIGEIAYTPFGDTLRWMYDDARRRLT